MNKEQHFLSNVFRLVDRSVSNWECRPRLWLKIRFFFKARYHCCQYIQTGMIINPILPDISQVKTLQGDTSDNEGAWEDLITVIYSKFEVWLNRSLLERRRVVGVGSSGLGLGLWSSDGTLEARTQSRPSPRTWAPSTPGSSSPPNPPTSSHTPCHTWDHWPGLSN